MADAYAASYAGYPPAASYPPAAYAGYPASYDPSSAYYYQQYQQAYQQPPLPQDSSLAGAPSTEAPPGSSPTHTANPAVAAPAAAPAAAAALPDLASAATAAATAQQQYAAYQQYQQYAAYQQYQQYQDPYASYAAASYGAMPTVMSSTTPPAPLSMPQQQQQLQQQQQQQQEMHQHIQQRVQQHIQQQQQQQQQQSLMGGAAGDSPGTPQAGMDKAAAAQKGAATAAALAARMSSGPKGYNAVPPPNNQAGKGSQSQLKIRPQMGAAAAFNARNAGANSSKAQASQAAPVYISAAPPSTSQQTTGGGNKGSTDVRSPAAAAAAQQKAAASGASKFPPSFTAWVERCFARCRVDVERQVMTRKLTARIKDVEAAGRMWMVDWDTEPIPSPSPDSPSSLSGSAPSPKAASGGLPSRMKRSRWAEEEAQQGLAAQQQLQPRKLTKQQRQQLWQQQQQQEGGKRQKKGAAAAAAAGAMATQEQVRRDARAGRFADGRAVGGLQSWHRRQQQDDGDSESDSSSGEEELDLSTLTVKGTCTDLEKSYFRLTAAPDPSVVRPEPVLRRALDRLVSLLRQDAVNYFYACDQLKGMRQDCTVQHLRGGVAVAVYEAHARASLEYGDLAEFNQCQTQLASLYPDPLQYLQQLQQQSKGGTSSSSGGSGGAAAAPAPAAGQVAAGCVAEFVAYKVLYNAAHAHVGANKTVLLHTLRTAMALAGTPVDASGCIAHALASRAAAASCNFPAFFRLYVTAPALGRALLDVIAPKLRWAALNMLVKAYKTNLPVSFVAGVMGFCLQEDGSKSSAEQQREEPLPGCRHTVYVGRAAPAANVEEGVAACVQWLKAHGAVVEEPEGAEPQLDVKASCTGRLFIPEEPKVSHGDENLSLQDFLSRAALGLGSNS